MDIKKPKECCSIETPDGFWEIGDRETMSCWHSTAAQYDGAGFPPEDFEATEYMVDIYSGFSIKPIWTPLPTFLLYPLGSTTPSPILLPFLANFISPPEAGSNRLKDDYLNPSNEVVRKTIERWDIGLGYDDVMGSGKKGWRRPDGEKKGEVLCFDNLYFVGVRR